jgi:hypothetical protein
MRVPVALIGQHVMHQALIGQHVMHQTLIGQRQVQQPTRGQSSAVRMVNSRQNSSADLVLAIITDPCAGAYTVPLFSST